VGDDDAVDPLEQAPDPDAREGAGELQREQTLARLETVLRRLPSRQREAFQLREWEGLSVDDAARAMNCSAGSVKTHLFRAMQTVREELDYDSGMQRSDS
jgi:RNA polymerase sigma-70 factor (ECF subfamily)